MDVVWCGHGEDGRWIWCGVDMVRMEDGCGVVWTW